jgi:MarR family 2-MHQ and catechol resistance regulon transcriptional repressor
MGSKYKGSPREITALTAFIRLQRAAESITHRLQPPLTAEGLSACQLGVLEALHHLGPLHQRDLGAKVLRSSGNITMVVDNLEKRGFVTRVREGGDRRYIQVQLTPDGEALISRIFPAHVAGIVEAMDVLSQEEQEVLGRLCLALGRAAGVPEA